MAQSETYNDLKFANWNPAFNDLINEIAKIRQIGQTILFKPENINIYYSMIVNLYSTYPQAIEDKEIPSKLEKIEDTIFSNEYIVNIRHKRVAELQRRILRDLRNIFTEICLNLSENGLTPKVEKKRKYNPANAVMDMQ